MQLWPAMQRWPDLSYLKAVAGERTVPVEVGAHYLAEGWGQRLMNMAQFLTSTWLDSLPSCSAALLHQQ